MVIFTVFICSVPFGVVGLGFGWQFQAERGVI
jgi:hypothetical protein